MLSKKSLQRLKSCANYRSSKSFESNYSDSTMSWESVKFVAMATILLAMVMMQYPSLVKEGIGTTFKKDYAQKYS